MIISFRQHIGIIAKPLRLFPQENAGDQRRRGRDRSLWDAKRMYIYTQDRSRAIAGKEYVPKKYPHHNLSNYCGEFSFARWRER